MDELINAEGFNVYNEDDAKKVEAEVKKIKYIESKMDYSNPTMVYRVYEKAIDEKFFETPAGLVFLKNLQNYLLKKPETKELAISPIPLSLTYSEDMPPAKRKAIRVSPIPKKRSVAFPCSFILNILLILGIVAMFLIALNSNRPNILNYEKALQDKYSSWDIELSEREDALRQKELELIKGAND